MWKKLFILSLSIAVILFFAASFTTVDAGNKNMKINWQIAGTIVQLIEVTSPSTGISEGFHSLINLSAQGSPGPAKITLLSRSVPMPVATGIKGFSCADDFFPIAYFDKNDFVALFPDQSLLFASINMTDYGILCAGAAGTYFKVKMDIMGGTGRFEGASGSFTGEGYGHPFSPDLTLVGESGELTGVIKFTD